MRAILATLVLSATVAGCALPAPSGLEKYQTLRASIVPTSMSSGYGYGSGSERMSFRTNRPAYVAIFEITPGGGTSLLYPSPGQGRMDGFTYSGMNSLHLRRHNSATYMPTMGRGSQGPRFIFMIASERPLDIARFGGFGYGLRSVLGTRFAGLNAYDSMEELARIALPSTADDGTWATDMFVYWPRMMDSRSDAMVLVQCNGYAIRVPFELLASAQDMLCDPRRDDQPKPNPLPGDSATIPSDTSAQPAQPQRRTPLPKADEASFRERITSSTQLEEAEARSAGFGARPQHRDALGRPDATEGRARAVRNARNARSAGDEGSVSRSAPRSSEPTTRSARPQRPRSEPSVQRQAPPRERPAPSRPSSGASSGSSSPSSGSSTKSKASGGAIKGS